MKVLILIKKVNKNCGLRLEVLYGRRIFKNHEFRKEDVEKWLRVSPTKSKDFPLVGLVIADERVDNDRGYQPISAV